MVLGLPYVMGGCPGGTRKAMDIRQFVLIDLWDLGKTQEEMIEIFWAEQLGGINKRDWRASLAETKTFVPIYKTSKNRALCDNISLCAPVETQLFYQKGAA